MKKPSEVDVLIVSTKDDPHAVSVAEHVIQLGFPALIINNADFPGIAQIEVALGNDHYSATLKHPEHGFVELSRLAAVWWRRPQSYEFGHAIRHPTLRNFAVSEWYQTFAGAISSINGVVLNPIHASRRANFKLLQLRAAKSHGLSVPRTLVTNSSAAAFDFFRSCKTGCIYKTFTGCDFGMYETRLISTEEDILELRRLQPCPTIFQEHVNGDFDIRATVVGSEIFSAKIDYKKGRHPVDSRIDQVPLDSFVLPSELARRLIELVSDLGLIYSAIDLRYSNDDGYTFFELNPEGQFLYIEIETGLPISRAIAVALLKNQKLSSSEQLQSI
jgi:glutathione synthase/RimK-type ligase-like ATP-grasp enzyme